LRIYFQGNIEEMKAGLDILSDYYGFVIADDGIPVKVEKSSGNIEVALKNGKGFIRYARKIHFFRAFGLFLEKCKSSAEFEISETPYFTMNGAMFDCSRNAVMTVNTIQKMLRMMAMMGLDTMLLYTEDTYTVEGQPYFGYMRGRYSYEELKACDDYADLFGIEIIPCIQTLAHLSTFLRWNDVNVKKLQDTPNILLAGSEMTYEFLEKCIEAASAPFRSKRIHIGMDEAHGLGLGKYLSINGYCDRFKILSAHLKRVVEITEKYKLQPMIWDDMYFKLGSAKGEDYDLESVIPKEVIDEIPKEVQLVYWDYYHHDEEFYRNFIKKHQVFGKTPIFAGGIHIWHGMGSDYGRTFVDTNAALLACKKEGVKEVFATIWNDNGSENNVFSAVLGLQLFAEHGYSKDLDLEKLKKRAKFCAGVDFDAFMDLKYLNEVPGAGKDNLKTTNPSKFLLWQDVLVGLFDKYVEGNHISEHYARMETVFEEHRRNNPQYDLVFYVASLLCSVLKIKSNIGNRIKAAYDLGNIEELNQIAENELLDLLIKIKKLHEVHMRQWFETYKPFGWEVLDIRYGGLIMRVETAIKRIKDYTSGRESRLMELEEERLYFNTAEVQRGEVSKKYCNVYSRIATANIL